MLNKKVLLLFLFCILLSINSVIALPPFQTSDNSGLQINFPKYEFLKVKQAHTFHIHVLNTTSFKTNLTTQCLLHLYNQTGSHLVQTYMIFDSNFIDYELFVSGNNFSSVGTYSYIIECNSTKQTGFISAPLIITNNGSDPDAFSNLYGIIFLSALSIIFLSVALWVDKNKWIVKSGLFCGSLLIMIVASSFINNLFIDSNSNKLMVGIIVLLTATLLIFMIYIIVGYLKNLSEATKKSKESGFSDNLS